MRFWVLILVLFISVVFPTLASAQCNPPAMGDWVVNDSVVCSSRFITLTGNLIINGTGNLTLQDSTLQFNSSSDGEYGIMVNTSLYVLWSTIESNNTHSYTFVSNPGAILEIHNSHIHDCGYNDPDMARRGIYVNSDGVHITKTNFSNNFYAIILDGSYSLIDNNSITWNAGGLLVLGGSNNVTNNFISKNGLHGIHVSGADNTRISGNMILDNDQGTSGHGIYLLGTRHASLVDNIVNRSKDYDIYMLSAKDTLLANTNYTKLWKGWYLNVTVVDEDGSPVEGADVTIKNNFTMTVFTGSTDSQGRVSTPKEEKIENATEILYFSPYKINASREGVWNSTSVGLTDDVNVKVVLGNVSNVSAFLITVESPENNSVYFSVDLINDSLLPLGVESNMNLSSCDYMLDSVSLGSLSEVNKKKFSGYLNVSDLSGGEHEITFICQTDSVEKTSKVIFSVYPERECLDDSYCGDDEECSSDYKCVKLSCGCGYASNHKCVEYECCEDKDCRDDEYCDISSHMCEEVSCDCGVAQNHMCVFPYPDYCCENSHCNANETCDVINHKCVAQLLYVYVPGRITQGETIKVYVRDQNNNSVSGATVTITYSDSGNMYLFSTNSQGVAEVPINESGNVQISARKSNYFTGFQTAKVTPSFNWLLFSIIFVVLFIAIFIPLLLLKNRMSLKFWGGPLKMEKTVSGRLAMLRVKNNTKETLKLLNIVDHVPRGAFVRCNVTPEIETTDSSTDRLKWTILELGPKEEIVIEYEARGFYKGFSVEHGGKRYNG